MLTLFKYFNTLSLDVVAGACISAIFVAEVLGVDLDWATVILMVMSLWVIYTFDHLNDGRQITQKASTYRHWFHQQYFKQLTAVSVAGLFIVAFLVFQVPIQTVVWGAALSCLVIAYFILLFLMKVNAAYHKEVMIAVLYSSGVMLPALSVYSGEFKSVVLIIFAQFTFLAFTNLLTFAVFEIATDERDKFPSLARMIGERRAIILLKVMVLVQIAIACCLSFLSDLFTLEVVILLMTAVLGGIIFLRPYFGRFELYRIAGDAIFLIPLIGIYL